MFSLPVTVEIAVGYGLVRVLVGSGNPDDCVLSKKSDDDYSFETVVSYCIVGLFHGRKFSWICRNPVRHTH